MKLTQEQKNDFMKKAAFVADKSSCGYKIGCVGVIEFDESYKKINDPFIKSGKNFTYIKTWNETVKGEIYCQNFDKNGNRLCIRQIENLKGKEFHRVCSIHAEVSLIAKCAKYGIKTNEMVLFITNSPCYICAKSIIQSGIKEIYYLAEHTDTTGIDLIKNNEILIEKLNARI
jgi:tRNA(Arg) A34 adenosine deaminase TadA